MHYSCKIQYFQVVIDLVNKKLDTLDKIKSELSKISKCNNALENNFDKLKSSVENISDNHVLFEKKFDAQNKKTQLIEQKFLTLESEILSKQLVITGMLENDEESLNTIVCKLGDKLNFYVPISCSMDMTRMGKRRPNDRHAYYYT